MKFEELFNESLNDVIGELARDKITNFTSDPKRTQIKIEMEYKDVKDLIKDKELILNGKKVKTLGKIKDHKVDGQLIILYTDNYEIKILSKKSRNSTMIIIKERN